MHWNVHMARTESPSTALNPHLNENSTLVDEMRALVSGKEKE